MEYPRDASVETLLAVAVLGARAVRLSSDEFERTGGAVVAKVVYGSLPVGVDGLVHVDEALRVEGAVGEELIAQAVAGVDLRRGAAGGWDAVARATAWIEEGVLRRVRVCIGGRRPLDAALTMP